MVGSSSGQRREATVEPASAELADVSPSLSVVVPCFDEEGAIEHSVAVIRETLAPYRYELVVVDDGSTDATARLLEEMSDAEQITTVTHTRNRGYGAALKTGIRHSAGDLIMIVDADGTYPIAELIRLLQRSGAADMVVGARQPSSRSGAHGRRLFRTVLSGWVSWLVGERIPDVNSGMRVFRRSVTERFFSLLPDGFSFTTTLTILMMRHRYRVEFVAVPFAERLGRSKIQPFRDTLRFVQLVVRTGLYCAPLRALGPFAAVFGVVFAASLAYDVFVLEDLTEKTLLFLLLSTNIGMFALLADLINRRSESSS